MNEKGKDRELQLNIDRDEYKWCKGYRLGMVQDRGPKLQSTNTLLKELCFPLYMGKCRKFLG